MQDDIQEKPSPSNPEETELIGKLFELTEAKNNPFRAEYEETLKKCYKFKELDQWEDVDKSALAVYGVPAIAVDRINRGLQGIEGIRQNTGMKRKVEKRERGDSRVADILNRVFDQVEYEGDFEDVADEAFSHLLSAGMGIKKCGFDYSTRKIWAEYATPEQIWYSQCKSKNLTDVRWIVQRHVMSWEEAALFAPEKAGEIKGLKTLVDTDWQKINGTSQTPVTSVSSDYGTSVTTVASYPDSVEVWEFWVKKLQPYVKVASIVTTPVPQADGSVVELPTPNVRAEAEGYQAQEGETAIPSIREYWMQYVVAGNKKSHLLLMSGEDEDHPFVGYCAERKKNGAPRGYIEHAIPHQIRINLAWGQKVAFNNKSLKSPIIARDIVDVDAVTKQSQIGMVLNLTGTEKIEALNVQPQPNLQAIEEGNIARQDMDFSVAATEEALRGVSSANASGLRMSMQQNAAMTPLNKWVKSEQKGDRIFARKILRLIIKHFSQEDMMRIVGESDWMRLIGPKVDPMSGQMIEPPLQLPIRPDAVDYDVVIMDQSISDLNKQQEFNASETLVQGGVLLTDEFRIKTAPLKNVDEALEANRQQRNDVIKQLMGIIQQLQGELQIANREAAKAQGSQKGNASKGASASQAGKRSMIGGQNGTANNGR